MRPRAAQYLITCQASSNLAFFNLIEYTILTITMRTREKYGLDHKIVANITN